VPRATLSCAVVFLVAAGLGATREARFGLWRACVLVFMKAAAALSRTQPRGTLAFKCTLTFELSGRSRHGAWAARRSIDQGVARPKCHAGGGPLERRVRPRSGGERTTDGAAAKLRTLAASHAWARLRAAASGARRTKQLTSLRAWRAELAWSMDHLKANKPLKRRSRHWCVRLLPAPSRRGRSTPTPQKRRLRGPDFQSAPRSDELE
jgi:hypothetical protein